MAFPDSFVVEVRQAADIVRLVAEHVSLRKMGASWTGLCPFHQEKTPSFNVRSEPPLFHCFGCGEGGDVFKFVMLQERVGFPEAVEITARRFGIPVPERNFEAGPERQQREEMLALLEAAAQHFSRNLWGGAGAQARAYLLGRGLKKETLERIRAGAAPDSWTDLLDGLKGQFRLPALLAAGLVLEKQNASGHYDRLRNHSTKGMRAARQAGLFCVAVPNHITRQMDTTHADLHLDALSDLPLEALIARIEGLQTPA